MLANRQFAMPICPLFSRTIASLSLFVSGGSDHTAEAISLHDIVELSPFLDHRGQTAGDVAERTGSLFGQTILGTNPR
jgi:hypothetical protein